MTVFFCQTICVFLWLSLLNIHVGICLVLVSFICCVLFSWSPSTSVFLHLDLFIYLSIYLAMHLYIYLAFFLSNDIFIYLYIYFFVSSITILLAGLSHPPFLLVYLVLLYIHSPNSAKSFHTLSMPDSKRRAIQLTFPEEKLTSWLNDWLTDWLRDRKNETTKERDI